VLVWGFFGKFFWEVVANAECPVPPCPAPVPCPAPGVQAGSRCHRGHALELAYLESKHWVLPGFPAPSCDLGFDYLTAG